MIDYVKNAGLVLTCYISYGAPPSALKMAVGKAVCAVLVGCFAVEYLAPATGKASEVPIPIVIALYGTTLTPWALAIMGGGGSKKK